MSVNETLQEPLPIDYKIPTYGCKAGMRGTGGKVGWLNIEDARIHDFIQPAIFPETLEVWPPGSCSEIGWLHYKGEMANGKEPTDEHPFEYDLADWATDELPDYTIDLLVGKEMEFVKNVMPPTNCKVFWDSAAGGKFDGVHTMSAWRFTTNEDCKFYFLGYMGFRWDVPRDLDATATYRLRFTSSSNANEEHVSGPFRISSELPYGDVWLTQIGGRITYLFSLFAVITIAWLIVKLFWRSTREGKIRLEESNEEL